MSQITEWRLFSLRKQLLWDYNHQSARMVETKSADETLLADGQTQFGNARVLDSSDSIFVFKQSLSDYEEPPTDDEVSENLTQP